MLGVAMITIRAAAHRSNLRQTNGLGAGAVHSTLAAGPRWLTALLACVLGEDDDPWHKRVGRLLQVTIPASHNLSPTP